MKCSIVSPLEPPKAARFEVNLTALRPLLARLPWAWPSSIRTNTAQNYLTSLKMQVKWSAYPQKVCSPMKMNRILAHDEEE